MRVDVVCALALYNTLFKANIGELDEGKRLLESFRVWRAVHRFIYLIIYEKYCAELKFSLNGAIDFILFVSWLILSNVVGLNDIECTSSSFSNQINRFKWLTPPIY